MASLIVHVDINTTSSHDCWDIVFTDESVPSFEAASSTESMHDIVYAENYIAENAVLWTNVEVSQLVNVDRFLWAKNTFMDVYTLSKE